jgi:hypothetical protein
MLEWMMMTTRLMVFLLYLYLRRKHNLFMEAPKQFISTILLLVNLKVMNDLSNTCVT